LDTTRTSYSIDLVYLVLVMKSPWIFCLILAFPLPTEIYSQNTKKTGE